MLNFGNFIISQIKTLQFSQILQFHFKKLKNKFVNKKNSSSVIIMFIILKLRNSGRSTFDHSIFSIRPGNFEFGKLANFPNN